MFLTIKDYTIAPMICQGAKISQLSRSTFCSSCSKRFKSEAWGVSCFTLGGIAPSVLIFAVVNVPLTIKDYSITLGGCQAPNVNVLLKDGECARHVLQLLGMILDEIEEVIPANVAHEHALDIVAMKLHTTERF